MKLLSIDTSGKVASVAVTDGGLLLAEKSVYTSLTHSQIILPMAKELLDECALKISDLDGLVCAKGPGSYTGLRIGISAVKGLVMGCEDKKLLCAGVSTLEAFAWSGVCFRGQIAAVMKARKDVVYFGMYESDGEYIRRIREDRVCTTSEMTSEIKDNTLIVGDCCEEIKENFFGENGTIKIPPAINRLQRASSLCMAFEANKDYAVSANELNAAYLQETKAEKLVRNEERGVVCSVILQQYP